MCLKTVTFLYTRCLYISLERARTVQPGFIFYFPMFEEVRQVRLTPNTAAKYTSTVLPAKW